MRGAVVSVDPVTATLPVLPGSVQSVAPPFCGAAVGHEPAAVAVPDTTSVGTTAATKAASTAEEYNRKDFTAIRYSRYLGPLHTHTTNSDRAHTASVRVPIDHGYWSQASGTGLFTAM